MSSINSSLQYNSSNQSAHRGGVICCLCFKIDLLKYLVFCCKVSCAPTVPHRVLFFQML
ncbi:hypothetical protein GBO34_02485 [Roseivirga pacifica]|nr:hypothetical protein [Roseivirga pacifica]MCO6368187.1 hypothetical protein [Roseivirga pacifica]MCO6369332.1 hypothetical protein [Roseivirga pacifica]MCO6373186.1 hypothetical protein [Roseivirga pacifica]MCO6377557.1 hypothetical protein [Roseivirga pacifica]